MLLTKLVVNSLFTDFLNRPKYYNYNGGKNHVLKNLYKYRCITRIRYCEKVKNMRISEKSGFSGNLKLPHVITMKCNQLILRTVRLIVEKVKVLFKNKMYMFKMACRQNARVFSK